MDQYSLLASLSPLQQYLKSNDASLEESFHKAYGENLWFIPEFNSLAVSAIANEFLDESLFKNWLSNYDHAQHGGKRVAIIMAGNVPLVGFHDLLCVLASGHNAVIKLSDKDSCLLKFIVEKWTEFYPELKNRITYVERLESYDAVIATGSNNSARYFEYYFRNHPHILRRNRNGVAVITGNESRQELEKLSDDIFLYFGLGCRNVSKLYVPEGYDFNGWDTAIEKWKYLKDHNKYRNNLDYNYAIYIINQVSHIHFEHLILKDDDTISSRIGCVHYSYYDNNENLGIELESKRNQIQCLISTESINGWEHAEPGQSQFPALDKYADGVDTMQFLNQL